MMILEVLLFLFLMKKDNEASELEKKIDNLEERIEQNKPRLNYDDESLEDLV